MPFEFLPTNLSNQTYEKKLKTTHLFSLCRSSIWNLMYLCNFRSPGSEIASCGIPLSLLSNLVSLIKIGPSKEDLCQISHNDLIIDGFSTANLYEVPCVTFLTLGPKTNTQKTTGRPLSVTSYEFNLMLKKKYDDFSQVTCLRYNSKPCKNPNFPGSYLQKYSEKIFEIRIRGPERFHLKWVFLASETSQRKKKKCYSENATMTCLEQRNPRMQSSDTKCYETSSPKDRKEISMP